MVWFSPNWSSRIKFTVDYTKVGATLTDFPVYIDLSIIPSTSSFWSNVKSDGGDLVATLADGLTRCSLEIVSIDTTNKIGELHFKAPSLSSTANTDFFLYYGNATATQPSVASAYGRNSVWSNGYVGVWHMNEANAIDSSGHLAAGTGTGTTTSSPAKMGSARYFNGSSDTISIPAMNLNDDTVTISAWIRRSGAQGNYDGIIFTRAGTSIAGIDMRTSTDLGYTWNDANWATNMGITLADATWSNIALVLNDTNAAIYLNGVSGTVDNTNNTAEAFDGITYFGQDPLGGRFFNGDLDEIRINSNPLSSTWLTTSYNNQNSNSTFFTSVTAPEVYPAWYNTSWTKRFKVTVSPSRVNINVTDFPVFLRLSDISTGHPFWSNVKSDGGDIVVTTSDGVTRCSVEVVDILIGSHLGEIHFKAPNLYSGAATEFYVYYGNASATQPAVSAAYGRNSVWSNSYVSVYHLNSNGTDSVGSNDGTVTNATPSSSGKMGTCYSFSGTNQYITLANQANFNITGALTVSAWVNVSSLTQAWQAIVCKGDSAWRLARAASTNYPSFDRTISGGYVDAQGATISIATDWHYTVGRFDNTATRMYTDSVRESSITNASATSTNSVAVCIGRNADQTSRDWNGLIDEVRISNTARAEGWIQTEYYNQNSSSTFYSISSQEAIVLLSNGGTGSDIISRLKVYLGRTDSALAANIIASLKCKSKTLDSGSYLSTLTRLKARLLTQDSAGNTTTLRIKNSCSCIDLMSDEEVLHLVNRFIRHDSASGDDTLARLKIILSVLDSGLESDFIDSVLNHLNISDINIDSATVLSLINNLICSDESISTDIASVLARFNLLDLGASSDDITKLKSQILLQELGLISELLHFYVRVFGQCNAYGNDTVSTPGHLGISDQATVDETFLVYSKLLALDAVNSSDVVANLLVRLGTLSDTDEAIDTVSLRTFLTVLESGLAAALLSQSIKLQIDENGTIDDSPLIRNLFTILESSDTLTAINVLCHSNITDSGTILELLDVIGRITIFDTELALEYVSLIAKSEVTDFSTSSEHSNIFARLNVLDESLATDSLRIYVQLLVADTKIDVVETLFHHIFVTETDTTHGIDSIVSLFIQVAEYDIAIASDLCHAFIRLLNTDSGLAADFIKILGATQIVTDTAFSTTVLSIINRFTILDIDSVQDIVRILAHINLNDLGTATELIRLALAGELVLYRGLICTNKRFNSRICDSRLYISKICTEQLYRTLIKAGR
jgi:hypothetical protein